jgi:hypothetical protein
MATKLDTPPTNGTPAPKANPDAEMAVMSRITRILAPLPEPARKRIIQYLAARYSETQ